MTSWSWLMESAAGEPSADPAHSQSFPTQSDAETWIGDNWRSLLDSGIEQVTLLEEANVVYGPMGLRPDA